MVRHGNAAPASPSVWARSRAWSRIDQRQRSASADASGSVWSSTGSTYCSVSHSVCPSYPGPVRPLAGIARRSVRAPAPPGGGAPVAGAPPPLRARAGLQHVEHPEPDRLLQLVVAVDLDVAGVPELVEVGPLLVQQALEPRVAGA